MFLTNVGIYLQVHMVLELTTPTSTAFLLGKHQIQTSTKLPSVLNEVSRSFLQSLQMASSLNFLYCSLTQRVNETKLDFSLLNIQFSSSCMLL